MDAATSSISTLTFSRMPQIQILQCKKNVSISFCQRTGKQIVCSKQKRCLRNHRILFTGLRGQQFSIIETRNERFDNNLLSNIRLRIEDHRGIETRQMTEKGEA